MNAVSDFHVAREQVEALAVEAIAGLGEPRHLEAPLLGDFPITVHDLSACDGIKMQKVLFVVFARESGIVGDFGWKEDRFRLACMFENESLSDPLVPFRAGI